MNPAFVSFRTQPKFGQTLIPIEIRCGFSQLVTILNYNPHEPQTVSTCVACVSNSTQEVTNSYKQHSHANYLNTTCYNSIPQFAVQHGKEQCLSKRNETNLYPPSLHYECDKLYQRYLETTQCKSKPPPIDNFIEDSSKNESTKSVDNPFSLELDCEELFAFCNANGHVSNCDVGMSQNETDGEPSFRPFSDTDSNNMFSFSPHTIVQLTTETNDSDAIPSEITTSVGTILTKHSSNRVSNKKKNKRKRPLSAQSLKLNKKVKPSSTLNSSQITWHHVSIDSKMNQQENTFVYENSFNMFETFSPANNPSPITTPSNSANTSQEFSSIIIETPESISKKMKRGRPRKDFQIE
ncbi:predicted protein [Naegleria gruberi]|uniref:Predicted protein n=1 Tax=Naegleria gruberi TaxID=5762 RepID=D2VIQ8_NAEGR|nr:uncharacterized protein NAEGRDRAFT_49869 [Naegleria gruberi]EFC43318.1 predicted protein [Naegleria gruberi]|eukprot:XP_002676062.1 predicted protein [Naegleria gruberi strain NEG-M]